MRKTITIAAAALVTAGAVATAGAAQAATGATAVHFAPGATSAQVSGQLAAGADREYTVDARAGQTATVHFTHSSATERWTLVGPDGTPLHTDHAAQQDDATVRLPSSGTYRLDVATGDAGSYTLDLSIPATIRFAAGGTSGAVSGRLAAGADRPYTFDARAGQTATVRFTHSSPTARWTLVGPDGTPLHTAQTQQQDAVTVRLPSSGTYRVDVQTTAATTYRLALAVPAA
jgi:hypothetical protein